MDFRIGWAVDGPAAALNAGTVALLQCSVAVPPAVKFRSCVDVKVCESCVRMLMPIL